MNDNEIIYKPIGYVKSDFKYRYETPRQGILAKYNISVIKLNKKSNFQQALIGIEGFERLWIIYDFHLNKNWKPMVVPPRHTNRKKVGVFASRAPYRPNSIGLSCVKLVKIDKLNIYITESDILDGSPVLDIKPYLPYSDAFYNVQTGWVKDTKENEFQITINEIAKLKIEWIKKRIGINLDNYIYVQLSFYPDDIKRKRIKQLDDNNFELSYRTWRIKYQIDRFNKILIVLDITSGYSNEELFNGQDVYKDKSFHIEFKKMFDSI